MKAPRQQPDGTETITARFDGPDLEQILRDREAAGWVCVNAVVRENSYSLSFSKTSVDSETSVNNA